MLEVPIQILSIIAKEFNEIRRQPRLIVSLILGPFLILLLFGMSFRGEQYSLDTALVVPGGALGGLRLEQLKQSNSSFRIIDVFTTEEEAIPLLAQGKVKVVAVLPSDYMQQILAGAQAPIEYRYNEVSPVNEQWIRYLGYSLVQELNRITVTESIRQFKSGFSASDNVFDAIAYLGYAQTQISAADRDAMRQSLNRLKGFVQAFAMSPLPVVWLNNQESSGTWRRQQFEQLADNLDWIDQALSAGTFSSQDPRVRETYNQLLAINQLAQRVKYLPPEVLAAPFKQTYVNVYGPSASVITFYAPGVFALIVQHIAITLAALSIVRERLIGVSEIYAAAPIHPLSVLLGKYLGHTLVTSILAAILISLLVFALDVPFIGDIWPFAGMLLLIILSSLGIGYIISVISKTDSQAVQLSMICLLASVFFGGLFLSTESFSDSFQWIPYLIPLSYGIRNFQLIMLRGQAPADTDWMYLGIFSIFLFACALGLWILQFRRKD